MQRARVLLFTLLAGCGYFTPELNPHDKSDAPTGGGSTTTDNGTQTVIDATDPNSFAAYDFDAGAPDTYGDATWDIAFSRNWIRTNGGVDGTGGVVVAAVLYTAAGLEAAWSGLTKAYDPATVTYSEDQPDGSDSNSQPDTIFENGTLYWYDYDSTWHTLSARPIIYVVRSTEGRYFKLNLLNYYSDSGVSAVYTFRWGEVTAP